MRHIITQKFYVYDPGVREGDEFGGLRVLPGDDGLHVLASPMMTQWWIDQGLGGHEPVSKLSGKAKKVLAQITRGRSENPDDKPKRLPKYSKRTQSGAPSLMVPSATKRPKKASNNNKKPAPRPAPIPA
jgi:hypothetical protein